MNQLAIEDVRKQLVDYFGSRKDVPEKIEEAIKVCKKEIDDIMEMLRMAGKASWSTGDKYVAGLLGVNDEDDKKGKQAIKEVKEEQIKKEGGGFGCYNRDRSREGNCFGGRNYGKGDSRDRKLDRKETRICYACRERGHIWRDCRVSRKDGKPGEGDGYF